MLVRYKKITFLAIVLSIFTLAFAPVTSATPVTVKPSDQLSYLALGDSLAAGQTPYRQIGQGYADFLAKDIQDAGYLGSFDKHFAKPGATTTDVLTIVQKPEVLTQIAKSDIITVHAGANDLLRELTITQAGVSLDPAKVPGILTQIGTNLGTILGTIKAINPHAKVYVIGYYNAFPYLPTEQQQALLQVLSLINQTIQQAASQTGTTYIDISTPFAEDPYAYLPNPNDVHPNLAGYKAISDILWNDVKQQLPSLQVQKLLQRASMISITSTKDVTSIISYLKQIELYFPLVTNPEQKAALVEKIKAEQKRVNDALRKRLKDIGYAGSIGA